MKLRDLSHKYSKRLYNLRKNLRKYHISNIYRL